MKRGVGWGGGIVVDVDLKLCSIWDCYLYLSPTLRKVFVYDHGFSMLACYLDGGSNKSHNCIQIIG